MDIALIGAPGSGKTELATSLYNYLANTGTTTIIDKYADEVAERTKLALDVYAGYIGNLIAMADRLSHEVACIKDLDVKNTILCGTILETATYMHLNASLLDADDPESQQKIAVFMNLLGIVFHDMFAYHHVFYLPYEAVDAETGEFKIRQTARFDTELKRALELFGVPYATLEGPTPDKFEEAVRIIESPPASE